MSGGTSAGDRRSLFIVDNSDSDWKVQHYLREWTDLAHKFDIATGYFEIGALLALDGHWQKLDAIRILMGDEVSHRTKKAFQATVKRIRERLDGSIEAEKGGNDFLNGVDAIVQALERGTIHCRVYNKDKFHAKAYITHGKHAVVGSSALVGSSNFTYPGLTDNVELNVQIQREVDQLQDWYERHWNDAEDVTPEILKTIERHTRDYTPFEVYLLALRELMFRSIEGDDRWETMGGSKMFPLLDGYQQDAYKNLITIAKRHGGAFLCDGVGLGKTFVGLMLIERLIIKEQKRVVLFAPKAALEGVWKPLLKELLSHVGSQDFSNLAVFSHTDLGRTGEYAERFERIKEQAHAVVIDEAHHFRNPGVAGEYAETRPGKIVGEGKVKPSRYRLMRELIDGGPAGVKHVYLLTATPINNKLADFRHMIELFSRSEDAFKDLGIHTLKGHFRKMETQLKKLAGFKNGDEDPQIEISMPDAESLLFDDKLFEALVVQRSRAYAKERQIIEKGNAAAFPERIPPQVAPYSVKKTYGKMLDMIDQAFHKKKPLFSLAFYNPYDYYIGEEEIDPFLKGRQKQVVGLIRCQFLKRFESSVDAFTCSCERLMKKLLAFVERHSESKSEIAHLERWKGIHADIIDYVRDHQLEMWDGGEDEASEDFITAEMLEAVEYLPRDEFNVPEILSETFLDLDAICEFMKELKKFKPAHDDKLKALVQLLKKDKVLNRHKVLIFTEFADTARYLKRELDKAGVEGVEEIDGGSHKRKFSAIHRFAPYYNGSDSAGAEADGGEIRVLISTDVLSEGLNLQDCTRLINYDIHWNPVRLMQRIGRVDRRMNPAIEARIAADHPDTAAIRGAVAYWNFLPPEELDGLLNLYGRITHKVLRISKTLGIEGGQLLTPDDDYEALKTFNKEYDGTKSAKEELELEYAKLLQEDPALAERINALPGRVFSGKEHPKPGTRAVFFCYRLPARDLDLEAEGREGAEAWSETAGETRWYLYDLEKETIVDNRSDLDAIADAIRSTPDTPRRCIVEQPTLTDIRKRVEKHIKNDYLKSTQAPQGVKPALKAWMELN